MKKAITQKGKTTVGVPFEWTRPDGSQWPYYNSLPDEEHFKDGWKIVTEPEYNPETQRKGAIYERENDFTYPIIDIPEQELEARFKSEAQSKQSQLWEEEQKKIALNRFQVITDPKEALEVKEAYLEWDENFDYLTVQKDHKVTRTLKTENGYSLELFFLITPHTPAIGDPSFYPEKYPAGWSWVKLDDDGYEIWTEPNGGDGKYKWSEIVTHKGKIWRNDYDPAGTQDPNSTAWLNVWEPGVFHGWTDLGVV